MHPIYQKNEDSFMFSNEENIYVYLLTQYTGAHNSIYTDYKEYKIDPSMGFIPICF